MKLKPLFALTAILSWINGIFYMLAPVWSATMLGQQIGPAGVVNTRYYGVFAFGWGILLWLARCFEDNKARRAVAFSIGLSLALSAIVGLGGIFNGSINAFGWSFVAIDGLLSTIFISIYFKRRTSPV
ncbi:MAG: hypothetical protein J7L73_01660 [Anaerolineales bacterium]|nr:hypothetical protein [Anaerolineales bacterium]